MQSLLRWSIENSATPTTPDVVQGRKDLDPAIIDHILGKPDSVLMKEALAVAMDEGRDEDERVDALDEFEMLVEQIDNASNVENLKMWEPLHGLLTSGSTPDGVKRQTLWIVGTAVQNNPAAQHAYLALNPLPTTLSFLTPDTPAKTRSKAVYALSGLLKHNSWGVKQLGEADGWPVLRAALEDSDIGVRRKTAFLLNALLLPSTDGPPRSPALATAEFREPVHANTHASMLSDPSSTDTSHATRQAVREHKLLGALIEGLVRPVPHGPDGESERDLDYEEKVVGLLQTYVSGCGGTFDEQQKKDLREYLSREKDVANWVLNPAELRVLQTAVA